MNLPVPPPIPDYELLRPIGRGSYGDVWLARGVTGVWRAIKIVWRERFADAGPFEREFKGLKEFAEVSLGESIQLALLHVGRNEAAGFFYYVMELADDAERGRAIDPAGYVPLTLAELRSRRGRLAAEECVRFGVELARVLAGLHRRGLVHRDIKPSNVILVGGVPKLADIGLVAPTGTARTFVGTEGYVPPEGPGAPSADVFALGKVVYELATGLDRQEFPQLPPDLNRLPDHRTLLKLNEVILRACDPERERRYRDGAELLADLELLHSGRSPRARRVGQRVAIWIAAGLAAAAAIAWSFRAVGRAPEATTINAPVIAAPADEKSIAVLPFENMSDERENAFFADGVHEDVLAHLQDVSALKVISRASVMLYRDMKKPVAEIGRELGVAHVLTGSVRRAGNRVRVSGQLIRAATGVQLWARTYDRDATDVFAVQAELAREITGALRATLSPAERNRLGVAPTTNLAAYELVKQVRAIEQRGRALADIGDRILPLLNQAVALDPNYAEAWAMLSSAHTNLLGMTKATPEREALARAALAEADRLAPDAYPTLLAGANLGAVVEDRPMVNRRRARIVELFPGRAEAHHAMALTAYYERRWPDAVTGYRTALRLDPRNTSLLSGLFDLMATGRRFEEAEAIGRLLVELRPEDPLAKLDLAMIPLEWRGATEPIEALARELAAKGTAEATVIMARTRIAMRLGRSQDVVDLWRAAGPRFAFMPVVTGPWELTSVAGCLLEIGEEDAARTLLGAIRREISGRLLTEPRNTALFNQLGLALALEGDRAAAAAELAKARALIQANPAARWAASASWENTAYRSWVGETDEAIAEFRRLFRQTGRTPWANVHVMRRLWSLKPLRGHPQFEALLSDPANNAPLF